jgi:hypothetical protein
MKRIRSWGGVLIAVAALAAASVQAAEPIKVRLLWRYQDLATGMEVRELAPGQWPLWKTATVANREQAPIRDEIPDATLMMHAGQKKRFALVYTNHTDKPVYFFAAPHHADPPENALGFKFKCLCVNQAYEVPPGHTWYRVVEFRLAPSYVGDHLDITHSLIGLDAARAEEFNKSMRDQANPDM